MAIRNGALVQFVSPGGGPTYTVGTVPVNDTWLVKDVRVFNGTVGAQQITLGVHNADDSVRFILLTQSIPAFTTISFSGFIAMGPSNFFLLAVAAAGVHVWVSGAHLPGHI